MSGPVKQWSQHGEDEIVGALLKRLGIEAGFFVEFGAWDGQHFSNTYSLYERGWSGCYIEGDPERMSALEKNCPEDRIIKVNAFVAASGPQSLDAILAANRVKSVDVLSIDIDSDDYAVWEGVHEFRPGILIIEYNPTIPFDTRYVNPPGKQHGNSALSQKELSESKGYVLVDGTKTNLILLRSDLASKLEAEPLTLQALKDRLNLSRIFFAYDGTIIRSPSSLIDAGIDGLFMIPWANCLVPQPLPKFFRRFRDPGTILDRVRRGYGLIKCALRSPRQTLAAAMLAQIRSRGD